MPVYSLLQNVWGEFPAFSGDVVQTFAVQAQLLTPPQLHNFVFYLLVYFKAQQEERTVIYSYIFKACIACPSSSSACAIEDV